jgi:hypothetical protein
VTISEQTQVDFTTQADEADISIHNEANAWKNWLAGPKSGEVALTCNLRDDGTHDASTGILAFYLSGAKAIWRIVYPLATPRTLTFAWA